MKRILLWAVICCCFVVSSVVSASAALLQVSPGYPRIEFNNPQGITYDRSTGHLRLSAAPSFLQMVQGGTRYPITSGSMSLTIQVDPLGNLVGGVQDLVVNGTVRQPTGAIIHQGLLLRGEILEFGAQDSGTDIDYMDFRLKPTEGILLGDFQGKDIGLTLVMEFSTFTGSFAQNFVSGAKGHLGPIPPKYTCSGAIGDFVWNDANRNGIQDSGELGLAGVKVILKDLNGTELGSTITNNGGEYLFEGLCAGTYRVYVDSTTLPFDFIPSPTNVGDPMYDSDVNGVSVTLPNHDSVNRSIDFGFNSPCTGEIGDRVWHDTDRDGVQDGGEAGIPDLTVKLYSPYAPDPLVITTDASGYYVFRGLCSGDYRIEVYPPAGYTLSPVYQGGDNALDSNQNPEFVNLPTDGTKNLTIDFGFNTPCTGKIGDFVWLDLNRNGLQDSGEPGIADVPVLLLDASLKETGITAYTDANGYYLFQGLCQGTYHLKVATQAPALAGLEPTLANVGSNRHIDSNTNYTPVTLSADSSIDLSNDFGFVCTGAIGDLAWDDANKNGIQDAGEMGMAGVTVKISGPNGFFQSTLTNASGYYSFSGLCPGTYSVSVITPAGYLPTPVCSNDPAIPNDANCSPQTVVSNNNVNNTIDFGFYRPPASLGDFVWQDLNKNGIQDAGEPGIPGITVNLYPCGGTTPIKTAVTDSTGKYLFTDLYPGSYSVGFVLPAGYAFSPRDQGMNDLLDSDADTATGMTVCITLLAGQTDLSVDAGMYRMVAGCTYTQGFWKNHTNKWPVTSLKLGTVTYTQNQLLCIFQMSVQGNGLVSLSHQLIAAKLNLANGASAPQSVQSAIAMADSMIGGLVVPPSGTGYLDPAKTDPLTAILDEFNNGLAEGGPLHCDDVPSLPCTGKIGDFVWNDLNANGIQQTGEPGLPNVKVTLTNKSTGKSQDVFTDKSGYYMFTGVCAGSYTVTVATPSGMVPTPSKAMGSTAANDSNGSPTTVSLTTNDSADLTIDFGFYSPCGGKIGDLVWSDTNNNGIQDSGEAGIAGVTVTLTNAATGELFTKTTDSYGKYLFSGLCMGTYSVTISSPSGYSPSPSLKGTDRTKDSNAIPTSVTLSTNSSSDLSIDFGFYKTPSTCTGSIGDFVWSDSNNNGIQDSGEPGIANVLVTLKYGSTGAVHSQTTDAAGKYLFGGLCKDSYTVTVSTPSGYTASPSVKGTDRAKDSNGSPASVSLGTNSTSNLTIDFGFYKAPAACSGTIGDFVWNDLNANGIQETGEPGLFNVPVTLTWTSSKTTKTLSTTTDESGKYLFTGLCAGTYTVAVAKPSAYTPSPALQGTDRTKDSNATPSTVNLGTNSSSDVTVDFGFYKTPTPPQGSGCTPGYWKNHETNWPLSSKTMDNFDDVFGFNAYKTDISLLQALNQGGSGLSKLARHGTAAYLNAKDSRVNGYPLSDAEVKAAVSYALQTGMYEPLATQLDAYNNLGCPLDK